MIFLTLKELVIGSMESWFSGSLTRRMCLSVSVTLHWYIKYMYEGAVISVRLVGWISREFFITVRLHQG